ncbi:GNAT family N-acetyltransferase [Celeribacter sp. SCSIO 80788]|uniref:GNAT family N-acetyltransferase n=1 Tax=Celeribacter sp. SCSIO 80788 TaxID=3117013 RepID=UPI003DA1D7E5
MFALNSEKRVDGIVSVKPNTAHAAEILLIAVGKQKHGSGAGTHLLQAAEGFAKTSAAFILTIKTLASHSTQHPRYDSTRQFYLRNGVRPIEVFETL